MKKILTLLSLCLFTLSAHAGIVVIAHPSVTKTLTQSQVKKAFLGKLKKLPNGKKVSIIEYKVNTPIRTQFHSAVTNKSESQLKSSWARLIFTGKVKAPVIKKSMLSVVSSVSNNQGALGYVDSEKVADAIKAGNVKVVYSL